MNIESPIQTAYLIDDSEVDLFVQKRFIELSRFAERVLTFNSPIKALDHLQFDHDSKGIIFLDLNMPILSGFDFLDRLNSLSGDILHRFKVVILTSSNSQADRKKALEFDSVISFLSKPLSIEELNSLAKSND
jgi:CheY-like chemotaxis protein